jgi:hypothetical protein
VFDRSDRRRFLTRIVLIRFYLSFASWNHKKTGMVSNSFHDEAIKFEKFTNQFAMFTTASLAMSKPG